MRFEFFFDTRRTKDIWIREIKIKGETIKINIQLKMPSITTAYGGTEIESIINAYSKLSKKNSQIVNIDISTITSSPRLIKTYTYLSKHIQPHIIISKPGRDLIEMNTKGHVYTSIKLKEYVHIGTIISYNRSNVVNTTVDMNITLPYQRSAKTETPLALIQTVYFNRPGGLLKDTIIIDIKTGRHRTWAIPQRIDMHQKTVSQRSYKITELMRIDTSLHSDFTNHGDTAHSDVQFSNFSNHADYGFSNFSNHSNTAHSDVRFSNFSNHADHGFSNWSNHSDRPHSDVRFSNFSNHADHKFSNYTMHSDRPFSNWSNHSDRPHSDKRHSDAIILSRSIENISLMWHHSDIVHSDISFVNFSDHSNWPYIDWPNHSDYPFTNFSNHSDRVHSDRAFVNWSNHSDYPFTNFSNHSDRVHSDKAHSDFNRHSDIGY
ncbi:MAG: hypothetical protein QXT13_08575 [Pyrobaculum sp.]